MTYSQNVARTKWCPFAEKYAASCQASGCMMWQFDTDIPPGTPLHPQDALYIEAVENRQGHCGLVKGQVL